MKIEKETARKAAIAGVAGMAVGIVMGLAGGIAFIVLVCAIIVLLAYQYYKIKKGETIEPYGLIEKIQYVALGVIVAVIFYSIITWQILVGVFICIGTALLAAALIHAIRTDVLAMDN
ncbi:hypothetical protein MmiEs2_08640 [Methanimicrococcus stummii]|uniref:Uncharacterized protein n=1 Tax=Methanimicrococcus stummii TaxID=3028294 RepID=A0AA96VA16_9EURY|nr:hypothetical protein [Methanimicrococcus sp. Es2]WNY28661.1 hypothetical protein MmiEs2_08640 [Methanimicrococcus sp. Es2]